MNSMTTATMQQHFIDHLEKGVDWNKVFGVADSLYADKGFVTNADNFTRAAGVEKAVAQFSNLVRVDQKGYDFLYGEEKIEMKMGKTSSKREIPMLQVYSRSRTSMVRRKLLKTSRLKRLSTT